MDHSADDLWRTMRPSHKRALNQEKLAIAWLSMEWQWCIRATSPSKVITDCGEKVGHSGSFAVLATSLAGTL
eukprot:3375768-Lingulodinium_polyedra.AAC.1